MRLGLFLSRFTSGLWIVLVSTFLWLLISEAPHFHTTPFGWLYIKAQPDLVVRLPNHLFTCTEGSTWQCQAQIQNRSLELSWDKTGKDTKYNLSNCRALYDGQTVSCQEIECGFLWELNESYNFYEIQNDLGLSSQQLQTLQKKYWLFNRLTELSGQQLLQISHGVAWATSFFALFFVWFHPNKLAKIFSSIVCGVGVSVVFFYLPVTLFYPLLGQLPLGSGIFQLGAIPVGLGTIVTTTLLLKRRFDRTPELLMILSSSLGIFGLFSVAIFFTVLGEVDETLLNLMRWLSTAIGMVLAIVAGILLRSHTSGSLKGFLCLSSGLGAGAFAQIFFSIFILILGYVD